MNSSDRAGRYVQKPDGYKAFLPVALPPRPPFRYDDELLALLSEADRALARLDTATELLPTPELFVAMYERKEAVLSSQIEGTQASMVDLLEHEADVPRPKPRSDVIELSNYITAMNTGLRRLADLPLSLRMLREIHAVLLEGVRGGELTPGEFRRSQNWIGPPGRKLDEAVFVPPPHTEVVRCMGELETFLHGERPMPLLVGVALAHAQFETIHPFLDGNGRMGRLLITFLLCWKKALGQPTLYLSRYFKDHQDEYYNRLQAVRDRGNFEGWVRFFLLAVREVSREGTETARQIQHLREDHRALIARELRGSITGLVLLDYLFQQPVITVKMASGVVERTYSVANQLVAKFVDLGLLRQPISRSRNRLFWYEPYLNIFGELQP